MDTTTINVTENMIVRHMCPICKEEYVGRDMAAACADKGAAVEYPVGTVFVNENWQHQGKAFAVARNYAHGHTNMFTVWLAQATPSEFDVRPGPLQCAHYGPSDYGRLTDNEAVQNPNNPAVLRLVAMLTAAGYEPYIWNGSEAVSYHDWLAAKQKELAEDA